MKLAKLKPIREERKLTYDDLAVLSGVSHMTIRRAEQGREVTLANAKTIAKALRLGVEDLR